ncbi:uncharacterized protein BXZ73DRAFT_39614 [Epithele typhae]|uniref:uncharacterized protein n=1 Tax=Epithele typhae TaxID=378194 RepID=UPI0020079DC4|nr:uncharacterized protein BXZ73DRAFT_39614 [Epithele typhae]KAH9944497.1 hypothetical protein BXZ73DRAFT_39614 [Epithele typhae]
MGFCRRCGDIVVGPRCKCGGTSVAPVVKWSQEDGQKPQDPWSKTYVTRDRSPTKNIQTLQRNFTGQDPSSSVASTPAPAPSTSPTKRFPRPTNQKPLAVSLDKRVSDRINTTNAAYRPPSPLKHSTSAPYDDDIASDVKPEEGILPNLNSGSRLAKAYGSVLQSKESLSTFICAICSDPFPPDATIYPDPSSIRPGLPIDDVGSGSRFLCRPCFTANGGSKGDCPACDKAVLILKSEGGFVEASGKVWHKRCFCCEGCFKNISDRPMVDLLGRPSCADCFDTCLRRPTGNTPRKTANVEPFEERNNLGGTKRVSKSREGSPALEELEMRLGIKSRETTPAKDVRSSRFLNYGSSPSTQIPTSPPSTQSPLSKRYSTVQSSPTPDRLAARARAHSAVSPGSPALREALARLDSPDRSFAGDGSPVSRRSYNRLRSPELESNDGSPISSKITGTGSPRYGSPASKQPTADAIEEMKQRFLRQSSPSHPSSPGKSTVPSQPTTPTRRERRSRSRPRSSGALSQSTYDDLSSIESTVFSSPSRIQQDDTGRTAIHRNITGHGRNEAAVEATKFTLRKDRTGDAEVESLLGEKVPTADLIDLSSDTSMSSISSEFTGSGSMSRIPRLTRGLTSPGHTRDDPYGLGLDLLRTGSSTSGSTEYYSVPATPDLTADLSDAHSHSSGPSTPPSLSPPSRRGKAEADKASRASSDISPAKSEATTPTPKSRALPRDINIPAPLPADSRCAKCNLPLFSRRDGGKFVTVPDGSPSSGASPKTYHTSCFRCTVCHRPFEDTDGGRAVFVRGPSGVCHPNCAPPEKTIVRSYPVQTPRSAPLRQPPSKTSTATYHASTSRVEASPKTAPPTQQSFAFPTPRFGGSGACPGCHKSVSPMERGVVPGPQGSRWHAACLVCGGKEAKGRRKEDGKSGCGKKLDSAAKTDKDGGVWCRECLLVLPTNRQNSPSPSRSTPAAPSHHASNKSLGGGGGGVTPQFTGTTTLARQFTGLGGGDAGLMRQLTGGGISPTRQLASSPTKMHDGPRSGAGRFPRPKSAIGYASRTKSEGGEGRGMFLVRQLTGGKSKSEVGV